MSQRNSVWQTYSLTDVMDFREGPGILAKDFGSSGVPLIRLAGLKYGANLLDGCNYLDEELVEKKWSHFRVEEGDVLLSTSASLGEVAIVECDGVGAIPYTGIIRFRPRDSNRLAAPFIRHLLESPDFKRQVEAMGVGSVMKHFGPSHLKYMTVRLPGLGQQYAIAEVLGALDDKIAANRKLAAVAEALLSARFSALQLDKEYGDQIRLDAYFELNPKCAKPQACEPTYLDMQKLPTSDILVSDWDQRPAKSGTRFMNGDTLLARITPCLENRKVGYVDFLDDGEVGLGSTEYIVFRARPGVPKELAFFLVTSSRFRATAMQHMVGTSGRQRLSAADVAGFTLRKIEDSKLAEWGGEAAPLVKHLGSLRDENRTLASLREALLPRLMSGELRVRDGERLVENLV
ncbi:type I restriction enzyme, S subunit [Rhodococcus rhodochrous J3]|uniref:Type I restriction enzyme, S subunit n=1 Tax=Rhodococcus rhodochrous J3 TaxID=903528 RepID=A0ABY1MGY7_RHORH|nr:restriction endonuclease subunit S [Rhodococcus rhodochrous]MBF4478836.1 restriction endonuclease subunit S [Rhodococcus rhodochrous]SMG55993.1 type I restriction enzyme, S subunit [Rhodococcus rhodochrous J3]